MSGSYRCQCRFWLDLTTSDKRWIFQLEHSRLVAWRKMKECSPVMLVPVETLVLPLYYWDFLRLLTRRRWWKCFSKMKTEVRVTSVDKKLSQDPVLIVPSAVEVFTAPRPNCGPLSSTQAVTLGPPRSVHSVVQHPPSPQVWHCPSLSLFRIRFDSPSWGTFQIEFDGLFLGPVWDRSACAWVPFSFLRPYSDRDWRFFLESLLASLSPFHLRFECPFWIRSNSPSFGPFWITFVEN